ncbi:hypothetical protein CC2G_013600 [Coprinopsis cinerea AmutBmut pab1-1]|nr:hypothetical protein CC2G_013600 [Coprinopsis cinerea AmutBmut pab1-1]
MKGKCGQTHLPIRIPCLSDAPHELPGPIMAAHFTMTWTSCPKRQLRKPNPGRIMRYSRLVQPRGISALHTFPLGPRGREGQSTSPLGGFNSSRLPFRRCLNHRGNVGAGYVDIMSPAVLASDYVLFPVPSRSLGKVVAYQEYVLNGLVAIGDSARSSVCAPPEFSFQDGTAL